MRAVVICLALSACAPRANAPAVSIALPLPDAKVTAVQEVAHADVAKTRDEGDYASDRGGIVHLVEAEGTLAGTFQNGVLTCVRAGEALECDWYEGGSEGRARFARKGDGTLDGTWGTNASFDDGGAWVLTPIAQNVGAFSGLWDSNWGSARVTDTGHGIHVDYGHGTLDCEQRDAQRLLCDWVEGSTSGRAELVIESSRVLRGRWGNGTSKTDGGAWVFVRH